MLYLLQKIWAKMPWAPKFYMYVMSGRVVKKQHFFVMVFSQNPLPPRESGKCSADFRIDREENINIGEWYYLAFCDPRFAGFCQLLAKDLAGSEKLEIFKEIPGEVISFVFERINTYRETWWLWLRSDGSWVFAEARCTALAERVRLKE